MRNISLIMKTQSILTSLVQDYYFTKTGNKLGLVSKCLGSVIVYVNAPVHSCLTNTLDSYDCVNFMSRCAFWEAEW